MKGLDVDGGGGINNIFKDSTPKSKILHDVQVLNLVKDQVKVVSHHDA